MTRKSFPQMHGELLYLPASVSAVRAAGGLGQKRFQVSCLLFLYLHAKKGKAGGIFSLGVKIINSAADGWAGVLGRIPSSRGFQQRRNKVKGEKSFSLSN